MSIKGIGIIQTMKILLVEDDLVLADLIKERLIQEGYGVDHVADGHAARSYILSQNPDLVILDIMLPGMNGLEVCRAVRPEYSNPILILTAREDDLDQILGLELGADDFVIKPVRPRVLIARIRALLRRVDRVGTTLTSSSPIVIKNLHIDPSKREVFLNEKMVTLTTIEFELLWYLAQNSGKVVSRDDIHQALYNSEYDGLDRSIDVYVSRLRQKLGEDLSTPVFIKTIRGTGYLLIGE